MGVRDKAFWGGTTSGIFSMQSAIDIPKELELPLNQGRW